MKTITYLFMMIWCLYGVPKEEWCAMGEVRQDKLLDELAEDTMQELRCNEAEVTVIIEGRWAFIYGECVEGKYMAKAEGVIK